jgi:hypothetical protein
MAVPPQGGQNSAYRSGCHKRFATNVMTDVANPIVETPTGPDPGLCTTCQHARQIESDRGSIFFMCKLSFQDSAYAKYPRLPMRICSGYLPK